MLGFVLLVFFARSALALIDTNCTDGKVYLVSAFGCSDNAPKVFCDEEYPKVATPGPDVGNTVERSATCYRTSLSSDINEKLKATAVDVCPNTCGYCCLTPEFKCDNQKDSSLPCDKVTPTMCNDTTLHQVIAHYCPNVCGFCLEKNCNDVSPLCVVGTICQSTEPKMKELAAQNCKKTCNLCDKPSASLIDCDKVTPAMCKDTTLQRVMTEYCPKKCPDSAAPKTGTAATPAPAPPPVTTGPAPPAPITTPPAPPAPPALGPGGCPAALTMPSEFCAGTANHPFCCKFYNNGFCQNRDFTPAQHRQYCCTYCYPNGGK